MDILGRIFIMIICILIILYVSKLIARSYEKEETFDKKMKIYMFLLHFFFTSWFITVPGYIFIECFKYIITKK